MKKPAKRVLAFAAIALLVLALASCAEEVKKPTEDTILTEEAFAVVEGMRDAYQRKAFRDFISFTTASGYMDIKEGVRDFREVRLEFTPRWAEIQEDGAFFLNVAWKGKWTTREGVKELEGMAVFRLKGRPLKVDAVVKGSPFDKP